MIPTIRLALLTVKVALTSHTVDAAEILKYKWRQ